MENTKNTNLIYGAIGLVFGIIIMSLTGWGNGYRMNRYRPASSNYMMHQMPDGSMMYNVGMDMDSMMDGMMAALNGKAGDEFDKAFLSEMIVHHEGAVVMARAVLEKSDRPELIKLANDIISAQTSEIDMMKTWQKTWFSR